MCFLPRKPSQRGANLYGHQHCPTLIPAHPKGPLYPAPSCSAGHCRELCRCGGTARATGIDAQGVALHLRAAGKQGGFGFICMHVFALRVRAAGKGAAKERRGKAAAEEGGGYLLGLRFTHMLLRQFRPSPRCTASGGTQGPIITRLRSRQYTGLGHQPGLCSSGSGRRRG